MLHEPRRWLGGFGRAFPGLACERLICAARHRPAAGAVRRVALIDGGQDAGDVAHDEEPMGNAFDRRSIPLGLGGRYVGVQDSSANEPNAPAMGRRQRVPPNGDPRWRPGLHGHLVGPHSQRAKKRGKVAKYARMFWCGRRLSQLVLCQDPFLSWQRLPRAGERPLPTFARE